MVTAAIDTYNPAKPAAAASLGPGDQLTVSPRSITVLRGPTGRRQQAHMTDREETRARPNGDARASRADTDAGGGKQIILGTSRLESRVIVAPPRWPGYPD